MSARGVSSAGGAQASPGHHASTGHIVGIRVYLTIFAALLVLTGLTVWVAFLDLGELSYMHTGLALAIATVKAVLVVLWFMHVKYAPRLVWVFIGAGILWLALMIGITLGDYLGRGWERAGESWRVAADIVAQEAETS